MPYLPTVTVLEPSGGLVSDPSDDDLSKQKGWFVIHDYCYKMVMMRHTVDEHLTQWINKI